jgi:hypothetical protein
VRIIFVRMLTTSPDCPISRLTMHNPARLSFGEA